MQDVFPITFAANEWQFILDSVNDRLERAIKAQETTGRSHEDEIDQCRQIIMDIEWRMKNPNDHFRNPA